MIQKDYVNIANLVNAFADPKIGWSNLSPKPELYYVNDTLKQRRNELLYII